MKRLLLLSLVILSFSGNAQIIAVFSKTEKCYVTANENACSPGSADKTEFLAQFRLEAKKFTHELTKASLITPPLEWGKKVSDSTFGEISYLPEFKLGFYVNLKLVNLLPDHFYSLCLNGNPKLVGNDLLPDTVPNLNIEKYYDFLLIKTNSKGYFVATIGVFMKPGDYHVRFYVKDTNGYNIVLFHDYFKFSVISANA